MKLTLWSIAPAKHATPTGQVGSGRVGRAAYSPTETVTSPPLQRGGSDGFTGYPVKLRALLADRPVRRRLDELGVLPEHPAGVLRGVGGPAVLAGGELCLVDGHVEGAAGDVQGDLVAVADEGDRAAVDGLRGDVADAQAGRAPGEAAVGDQEDVLAEPGALDGTGDREHLAHPRAALGALVADHHHVTGDDQALL